MKKIIAICLIAVMVLSMAACGTINQTEVSVLWSGDGVVKIPNSLINAMERAMYIENIAYKHYGANGDQAEQTKQAEAALNAGCAALAVELVDTTAAQAIVDAAKAKDVPVVFFNCDVEESVATSYSKCIVVNTLASSLNEVYGKLIGGNVASNFSSYDRNGDGKITYALAYGTEAQADSTTDVIAAVDAVLTAAGKPALVAATEDALTAISAFTEDAASAELIITDNDATALEVLKALQDKGYNSTKLKTHNIPLFTVGTETDAKAFKDTSTMSEEEKAALIYTVTDIIGEGKMTGSAVENYDGIAVAVAAVLRNLLKGNDTFKDITDTITGTWSVGISYTTVS